MPLTTYSAAMVVAATFKSSSTRSQFLFKYIMGFKCLTWEFFLLPRFRYSRLYIMILTGPRKGTSVVSRTPSLKRNWTASVSTVLSDYCNINININSYYHHRRHHHHFIVSYHRYFSWNSGHSHRSSLNFHTAYFPYYVWNSKYSRLL